MDALSQRVFGVPYDGDEIGNVGEIFMARSADDAVREKAQYGGTVTTLLSLALEEGLIDGAIMTKMSDDKIPAGFLARNAEEILQCAGSSYMACPVLATLNHIPKESNERLAIVAMPCQALSLAKWKTEPPQNRVDIGNVKVVIGLFCTWALSHDGFYRFLKDNLDLHQVKKFDIPPPPANRFDVYTSSGRVSFPLDDIRKFTMPTCAYCLDMTSEFADISVGSVEGMEGWNTVIVRSGVGAGLVELARSQGRLETDTLPQQNLAHLKEAAFLKKKRALRQIVDSSGDRENLIYLGLSRTLVDKLLA